MLVALSTATMAQPISVTNDSAALAGRQQRIDSACDPIMLPPGSPPEFEREMITAEMGGDIGPTPVAPGMKVPAPFNGALDMAKGIFDRWTDLSCVDSYGAPRLTLFASSVEKAFGFGPMKEVRPVAEEVALRQIEAIRQRFPGTAFAVLVEAVYLHDSAWDARGNGYMSSVTAEGMRIFNEDIAKEKELLLANKKIGLTNPFYYVALIQAEGSADGYSPEMIETFKEGATRFKFYDSIYIAAIRYSEEKWGGSWDAIDQIIRWAADNTRSSTGEWMYARLYGYVGQDIVKNEILFSATPASWPLMRTGYLERLKKVPTDDYRLNLLVRYSCEAGDHATYLAYRPMLDTKMKPDAWQGSLSSAVCDEKFKYRPRKT
jgi:hypothetical protein